MATVPQLPNMTTNTKWASRNQTNFNIETSIEVAQVQVTSAQLKALATTAIQIVPAPVITGEAITVRSICLGLNFLTAAYTLNTGTLKLFYGPVANALALTGDESAILTQTANAKIIGIPPLAIGPDTNAHTTNQPIMLGNDSSNYTVGAGTLTVTVEYSRTTP